MKKHFQTAQQYCKQIGQLFSILMGLTSYWYDYKKADFKRNILTRLLFVTVNVAGLTMIIHYDKRYFEHFALKDGNPVLYYMLSTRFVLILLPPLCTFGQICLRDSRLVEIKQRLQSFEMECRTKFVHCQPIERNVDRLYYLKMLITAFMYLMLVYWYLITMDWKSMIIFYMNIIFLSALWMFQYFQVMAKICRLFHYFNKHLQQLAHNITVSGYEMDPITEHGYCLEMFWLRRNHFELCCLWQELDTISKWLIFLKRLVSLISIGIHLYMSAMELHIFHTNKYFFIYDLPDFLPEILDFYVVDCLYDLTKQTFGDLELTLKDLQVVEQKWRMLYLECDVFSLYLCFRKSISNRLGLLNMGRSYWFAMISAIAICAIVLSQAHLSAE
uniref:Gustatory receptor n=1 Tax=Stomoxys calcitrans TaxID=35570 RepID=A0A2Y9D4N0_STOCA